MMFITNWIMAISAILAISLSNSALDSLSPLYAFTTLCPE